MIYMIVFSANLYFAWSIQLILEFSVLYLFLWASDFGAFCVNLVIKHQNISESLGFSL